MYSGGAKADSSPVAAVVILLLLVLRDAVIYVLADSVRRGCCRVTVEARDLGDKLQIRTRLIYNQAAPVIHVVQSQSLFSSSGNEGDSSNGTLSSFKGPP